MSDLKKNGLDVIGDQFDEKHRQLFTFALESDKELVNLRAVAQGKEAAIEAQRLGKGTARRQQDRSSAAQKSSSTARIERATLYDRRELKSGNELVGPVSCWRWTRPR